jgi:hypothetical protein
MRGVNFSNTTNKDNPFKFNQDYFLVGNPYLVCAEREVMYLIFIRDDLLVFQRKDGTSFTKTIEDYILDIITRNDVKLDIYLDKWFHDADEYIEGVNYDRFIYRLFDVDDNIQISKTNEELSFNKEAFKQSSLVFKTDSTANKFKTISISDSKHALVHNISGIDVSVLSWSPKDFNNHVISCVRLLDMGPRGVDTKNIDKSEFIMANNKVFDVETYKKKPLLLYNKYGEMFYKSITDVMTEDYVCGFWLSPKKTSGIMKISEFDHAEGLAVPDESCISLVSFHNIMKFKNIPDSTKAGIPIGGSKK